MLTKRQSNTTRNNGFSLHRPLGHHGHRQHRPEYGPPQPPPPLTSRTPANTGSHPGFCKDLLTNPAIRNVSDVAHKIAAVASLSGVSRAADFIKTIDGPADAATYGTYAELVADPNVDIIYVATPHSHHFQNAMLALEAGKNVLCEKAFTVTAEQARLLVEKAREKKLFLMEAVWTRFHPWSVKIRELVKSGAIGKVHRVICKLTLRGATVLWKRRRC